MKKTKSKLKILYEDKDILVINKPAGMIVHPQDEKDDRESVSEILLKEGKVKKNTGDKLRCGIVHRLDKDTSGTLVVARNQKSYKYLVEQFKKRAVDKLYIALVLGKPKHPEGIIDSPIGRGLRDRKKMALASEEDGKSAISQYKVIKTYNVRGKYMVSLVEVKIYTGRTHQIRVHMAAIGNSIIGDTEYGNKKANEFFLEKFNLKRQFLHSKRIGFTLPDKKKIEVEAKIPRDLGNILGEIAD